MDTPPVVPPPLTLPTEKPSRNPFFKRFSGPLKRSLYIALSATGLLIVAIIFTTYLDSRGTMEILDTSKNITITLNDHAVSLQSDLRGYSATVYPGVYRLKISKPNYAPFVQDVQISRRQTTTVRPSYSLLDSSAPTETNKVDFVLPSPDQKYLFYLGNQRHTIFRLNLSDNSQTPLNDQPLENVLDVQWSTDPNVALISQSDGVYLHEIPKYDFKSQTLLKLGGTEIISPIWDPKNPERIAFAYFPSTGEKSLIFADKQAQNMDRKADLHNFTSPHLIWSSDDTHLLILNQSSNTSQNNIWVYDTASGSLTALTTSGEVTDASFSTGNDTVLYETTAPDGHSNLNTIRIDGSNNRSLNIVGHVKQAAWYDNSSFLMPTNNDTTLTLYSLTASNKDTSFNFPRTSPIVGMYYYSDTHTLIFYTSGTIYTTNLTP